MKSFLNYEYENLLNEEAIDQDLYDKYDVKRGLRNNNGTGVLVGLTRVAEVSGYYVEDGVKKSKIGNLYYRGIDIREVVKRSNHDFNYEDTCFLLLFGHYPNKSESKEFRDLIVENYDLPKDFLENIILKNPSKSLMNHITRSILALYSFDDNPDDLDGYEFLKKGISLIAKMPAIVSYSLQAKTHYLDGDTLHISFPRKDYSLAENILYLSRNDGKFTKLEAQTLDMALTVHADHGGGNNSAFVGTTVASTYTDIYSMLSASLASLKGPRHGGANQKVLDMVNTIIKDVSYDATDEQLIEIINKLLAKEYFDNTGLIYGIGHAIYTLSDPRCELLKAKGEELAKANPDNYKKFKFYQRFEELALKVMEEKKGTKMCANVDYYSGLVYEMLGIPRDLFIPIFAAARLVGWISHDLESLLYNKKIVRPATKYVGKKEEE